jgi:glycerophosphoryl diester phosphodiesterase
MLPISVPREFCIIAHRGASAYAPENTITAFETARKMGVAHVELDVQITTDGVVVVCHDETLERYGHGTGVIEELPSGILLKLDMGSWFSPHFFCGTPMITLGQLLSTFGDTLTYHIELKGKSPELANAVQSLVSQAGLQDRSIFTSFSADQLVRMRRACSDCRLAWLVDSLDDKTVGFADHLDLYQLCPRADLVTDSSVRKGRCSVPEIRAWGLNGRPQDVRALVHRIIEAGCDGMTINWPDWVTHDGG